MKGEKYVPVPVHPQESNTEDLNAHLRAFIAAFIRPSARERWEHCLLAVPRKARKQLLHFHRDLDPAHCRELQGAEGFPLRLHGIYGDHSGVYFDGTPSALVVTAAEAATLACENFADALLSLTPGKQVLCFDHEGGTWVCER